MKNYSTYSEIPQNISEYVCRVADLEDITNLSIEEINEFLQDLEDWYLKNGMTIEDFVS